MKKKTMFKALNALVRASAKEIRWNDGSAYIPARKPLNGKYMRRARVSVKPPIRRVFPDHLDAGRPNVRGHPRKLHLLRHAEVFKQAQIYACLEGRQQIFCSLPR